MGCMRCIKFLLIAFNFMSLIIGAVAIGIAAWVLSDDYGAEDLEAISGTDLYYALCIVVIVAGSVAVVVSFLGCCGAWTENRCMLGTYFAVMLVFLILFVIGAAIAFFYYDDLEDELEDEMTKTLQNDYNDDEDVKDIWDKIQEDLKCCGVSGGLNSTTSWYMWRSSTFFSSQSGPEENRNLVPSSCCNEDVVTSSALGLAECQKESQDPTRMDEPPRQDLSKVTSENPALYSTGCLDKVKDEVEEYIVAIEVVSVIAFVILFCCVVFSVCICMNSKEKDMVV